MTIFTKSFPDLVAPVFPVLTFHWIDIIHKFSKIDGKGAVLGITVHNRSLQFLQTLYVQQLNFILNYFTDLEDKPRTMLVKSMVSPCKMSISGDDFWNNVLRKQYWIQYSIRLQFVSSKHYFKLYWTTSMSKGLLHTHFSLQFTVKATSGGWMLIKSWDPSIVP